MSKDSTKCCIGMFIVLGFISFMAILTSFIIPYTDSDKYAEHTCNITNIVVPSVLPTKNNTYGWKECKCGRQCKTYTPCIQLYSDINPNIVIRENYYEFYDDNSMCTFYNYNCKGDGNILNLEKKLIESHEIYKKYFNTSIPCFYNDEKTEIFLKKEFDNKTLIFFVIIFGLSFICIFIQCIVYYDYQKKEKNVQKKNELKVIY